MNNKKTKILTAIFYLSIVVVITSFAVASTPSFEIDNQSEPFVNNITVAPAAQDRGSSVVISSKVKDVSGVNYVKAQIKNSANAVVATINLYDDGIHNDGASGDNIYANSWSIPASFPAGNYGVFIIASDTLSNVYQNAVADANLTVTIPACADTCASLGYECGIQTICSVATNCGNCTAPEVCSATGQCILPGALTVSIILPGNNEEFKKGDTITFSSSVSGGIAPYTYSWISVVDGNIGNSALFSRSDLSNDRFPHNITLTVIDSIGATVTDTIQIAVYYPIANIIQPLDGSSFTQIIDTINFSAGSCESKIPYAYTWTSNIDGNIGNTQSFSSNGLSAGNHIITLLVADDFGQTVTNSASINVSAPIVLTAKIVSPVADTYGFNMYAKGNLINFDCLAVGGTAPYIFSWVSDKDGAIDTVQSFNKNNLTAGHHIVTLTITDAVGTTVVNITELDIIECLTMVSNGIPSDKIDVVFLGCNYDNTELNDFRIDADVHKNEILSWEPFSTDSNKMNFYRIEMLEGLLCDSVWGACGTAGNTIYKKMASFCPNDEIIVLEDDVGWRGCWRKDHDMIATSAHNPPIVVHEFGHAFGLLMDEYLFAGVNPNPPWGPNCDIDATCPRWTGVPGTGCFGGCYHSNYYRPTGSCMMIAPSNNFCPVCKNHLQNILNSYP